MCIIAIKRADIPMPDEKILKTMFDNNSDGAGFMYYYNNKVIIQKGYMTYESFKRALNELERKIDTYKTSIVFHFRIATHGSVCRGLCHPFPLSHKIPVLKHQYTTCNLGIVHNGIIPIKPRKGISDTMEYIVSRLSKIERECPEFYKSKKKRKAILAEINSKMVFLDCDGNVYTIGDFINDNGILYSNDSYKERDFIFKYWNSCMSVVSVSPIEEGYIISDSDLIECEYGQYFIDKYGRVFEYDYGYDFACQVDGTAYTLQGLPVFYDEDNKTYISVWE